MTELRRALVTDHVILSAPRRFGKTGAMFQLIDEPGEWNPVYMNVQYIESPKELVIELTAALTLDRRLRKLWRTVRAGLRKLFQFFRQIPDEITVGELKVKLRSQDELTHRWEAYGTELLRLLATPDHRALVMLDEFPIMVQHLLRRDVEEAERCLRWLQRARHLPSSTTRFLIAGSINLLSTLDRASLVDTATDLRRVRLPPWNEDTARRFIGEILKNRDIQPTEALESAVLREVGECIPYMVSLVLNEVIHQAVLDGNNTIDPASIALTVEKNLLRGPSTAAFMHYRTRIHEHYPDEEGKAALAILKLLSLAEQPFSSEALYWTCLQKTDQDQSEVTVDQFNHLMDRLENDFYVRKERTGYTFCSLLLKRWWLDRYGFQSSLPAAEPRPQYAPSPA